MPSIPPRSLWALVVGFGIALILATGSGAIAADQVPSSAPTTELWVKALLLIAFLAFVLVITLYLFWYAFRLNRTFLQVCSETGQIGIYAQAPFGLPAGTVQSMLALFIVLTGIGLVLLTVSGGPFGQFPEVLSGVLGTVLGFYFGSRAAAGPGERAASQQMSELGRERDAAIATRDRHEVDRISETVRHGLDVIEAVTPVLPEGLRNQALTVGRTVRGGLDAVVELRRTGDVGAAVRKATELAAEVRTGGPLVELLTRCAGTIGPMVGGAVPALGLVMAIATIGARLTGAAYERWLARVMNAPYTPALFDPAVIDANTGLILLARCPRLSATFADEIGRGDRRFVQELVRQALSEAPGEAVWQAHPDRFADLEEVDAGVAEFQQAALELELAKDVQPDWAKTAGNLDQLLGALARIGDDDAARGDLDAAVMAMDRLRRADRPVEQLFGEAQAVVAARS